MKRKKVVTPQEIFGEVFDEIVEYIQENMKPEQIFDEDTLETWSYKMDFVQRKMVKNFYTREEAREI
jgi:hypothetical protein